MYEIRGIKNKNVKFRTKTMKYDVAKKEAERLVKGDYDEAVVYEIIYDPCVYVSKKETIEYE